ncbi:MAG TPA: diaminopimelate epimerase, partial [Nitrospirae bacterium]|nr:diaminopimelate epimerase [Nitrospirota bacterium]
MNLNFTKMQALGNDFVLIDSRKKRLKNISRLSKALCDRRFGIGADQMLLLNESTKADFKMRIFNADGSEVEMCGNGIRCFAKYIWDNKLMVRQAHHPEQSRGKNHGSAGLPTGQAGSLLEIETLAGIIRPQKSGNNIKVDMGEPV